MVEPLATGDEGVSPTGSIRCSVRRGTAGIVGHAGASGAALALPDVIPPAEDPVVVPLVAVPPVAELPLAEPLLDCASA